MTEKAKPVQLIKRARGAIRGPAGMVTLTEDGLKQVELDARNGLANATIASRLRISRSAFNDARKRDPRIDEALERGRAGMEDELVDVLMSEARKGDKVGVIAAIFLLKARCGYRDQGPLEGVHTVNNVLNVNAPLTTPELRRRFDELLRERERLLAAGGNGDEGG